MSIIHYTAVDFTRRVISEPVHIVQGDRTLPTLAVELLSDGQPYTVPDGAQVNIALNKKDGTFVLNKADSVDGNIATFTITAQMAAVAGDFTPEVQIVNGAGQATTGKFPYIVDKAEIQEGMLESTSEVTSLIDYADRAEKAADRAEDAAKVAETVTANTEAAQKAAQEAADKADNAKYYKDQAEAAAKVVSDNKANIDAVAENVEALNTVSENIQTVKDINDNVEAVKTVSEKISDVTTVSENMENIGTVKDNIADVNTVAGAVTDVQTVSASIADVNTAAAHATDLENITANLEDIQNADDNAAQAKTQRDESEKFAQESEAWARGSIDGKDLADGEGEQYQNNSKYYSEQAAASKAQAAEYEAGAQNYYEQVKTYAGTVVPQLLLDPDTGRLYMSPDGKNINFALLEGHLYYQFTASA